MIIKSLKARILRALKSAAAVDSPPPSPTKPPCRAAVVVVAADAFSDDASFFDAHETPTKNILDDWELVGGGDCDSPPAAAAESEEEELIGEFPERCPPGGEGGVVLYTTTLRGIRKTFEDCNGVRSLLENLGVAFQERDVSMDRGLRDELWSLLGEKAVPPRLFVRGRDVGAAAQVLSLHEDGRLLSLLLSSTKRRRGGGGGKCGACGGVGFVVCGECDGSRKVFDGGRGERCRGCNENGLVMCRLCSGLAPKGDLGTMKAWLRLRFAEPIHMVILAKSNGPG
uniref:Glutaredoxin domain-containing protein n=1 Tax=Leersia perrieri TaxID=77586 RepID=A0A0D9WVP4_9ORYZ